jgi:hypothetical protein
MPSSDRDLQADLPDTAGRRAERLDGDRLELGLDLGADIGRAEEQ